MKKDLVYLIQTDTTVGLVCKDFKKLNKIKKRPLETKTLMTVGSFKDLKKETRVPKEFKKQVRRSKKTTYIYPNNAYRVVSKDSSYRDLLKQEGGLYSTSANETGQGFDKKWAEEMADVIIEDKKGLVENSGSKIYRLRKNKIKKIR
ncbi:MAG: Sua5 YciO YrdC YwlC family protein [Campylobacterales bacterium]|nr:Sua5 YciO YrdC YwlC family protein [Campylobacterales bacterium]